MWSDRGWLSTMMKDNFGQPKAEASKRSADVAINCVLGDGLGWPSQLAGFVDCDANYPYIYRMPEKAQRFKSLMGGRSGCRFNFLPFNAKLSRITAHVEHIVSYWNRYCDICSTHSTPLDCNGARAFSTVAIPVRKVILGLGNARKRSKMPYNRARMA